MIRRSISKAVVLMQIEVAQRIIAQPNCKEYGILSVVFQVRLVCLLVCCMSETYTYGLSQ